MKWVGDTIARSRRSEAGWGRHIRSYVVGRGVKDERTGIEQEIERTLDGDIDQFLRAALASRDGQSTRENR